MSVSTEELLARAVAPGGPLADVRERIEQEVAVEQKKADDRDRQAKHRAKETLVARREEYVAAREAHYAVLLQLVKAAEDLDSTLIAYQAANRVARSVGVDVHPIEPNRWRMANKSENAADRAERDAITRALHLGWGA